MSTFELVQGAIIGLAVLASAWVAVRKLFPRTSARWLASASARLNRDGRGRAMRSLGRRLQPATATGSCGDGCGTCNSCGPTPPRSDVQPLHFKPRA